MGFVYFIPGQAAASPAVLASVGLDRVLGRTNAFVARSVGINGNGLCERGTEGIESEMDGVLVGESTDSLRFAPAEQVWERAQEKPECWIGYNKAKPPTELALRRLDFRGGYPVMMGNGEEWHIPPARRYPEGTMLPCACKLGADGKETKEILAEYRDLWREVSEFAEPYYKVATQEPDPNRMYPDMPLATCIRLLGINYRVGRAEVNALGLITDTSRLHIALSAIDWWALLSLLAKKEEPTANPMQGA